ncbi:MAG: 30S ribosomal protein S1, partial [Bacteroidales bacterium]|nr:30S ribosomal protein S1 [Bacteroidales bacterium]
MRDLKNVQPLADFDWDAVGEQNFNYSAEQNQAMTEAYDKTFNQIGDQQVVEGVIVAKDNREVIVNIGFKSDGVIP